MSDLLALARRCAIAVRGLQPADRDDLEAELVLGALRNPHAEPSGRMRGDAIDWLRQHTGYRSGAARALRRPVQLDDASAASARLDDDPAKAVASADAVAAVRRAASTLPDHLRPAAIALVDRARGKPWETIPQLASRWGVVERSAFWRLAAARRELAQILGTET